MDQEQQKDLQDLIRNLKRLALQSRDFQLESIADSLAQTFGQFSQLERPASSTLCGMIKLLREKSYQIAKHTIGETLDSNIHYARPLVSSVEMIGFQKP